MAALKKLAADDARNRPGTGAEAALAELEGYELLAKGDVGRVRPPREGNRNAPGIPRAGTPGRAELWVRRKRRQVGR